MYSFRIHCTCIFQDHDPWHLLMNMSISRKEVYLHQEQATIPMWTLCSDMSLYVDELEVLCGTRSCSCPPNSQPIAEAFGSETSEGWQERKDAT